MIIQPGETQQDETQSNQSVFMICVIFMFQALPAIKKYMESEKFMKSPMNGKMARYGNE